MESLGHEVTWQQSIVDMTKSGEDRFIDVIVEKEDDKGKSFFALYCHQKGLGVMIPIVNNHKELNRALLGILETKRLREPGLIFMDLPRGMSKNKIRQIFVALERIKEGIVTDIRHSYKEWIFEPPKIWVTTNIHPDVECLSPNRLRIWTIEDGGLKQI
jgi:hypothetical protein